MRLLSLIISLAILGCSTTKTEYVYVDVETYMKWGSKRMVPIGTRDIPEKLQNQSK